MVSLVTLLLGIPPSIFVTILLDEYASKWPGKVEGEEEHVKETSRDVADTQLAIISDRKSLKSHKADNPQISYTGNAMRQASIVDPTASSTVTGDAAIYTYCNGKILDILFNRPAILQNTPPYLTALLSQFGCPSFLTCLAISGHLVLHSPS